MSKDNDPESFDSIFESLFFKQSRECNKINEMGKQLKVIDRFPHSQFIIEGDAFFKKVWKLIDQSQDYFWITTYAMDSSPAADTTLLKLIEATKRGVHVVLMIDNVQFWAKNQLIRKFENYGGRFHLLNPQFKRESLRKYLSQDVWRRHHEKLIVSDSKTLIGSSNIEGNYAGIKYGNCLFQDMNFYSENIILDQFRQHFVETADLYDFNLHTKMENHQILLKFNSLYPNSAFYQPHKYQLLHNDPKMKKKEIQDAVVQMVRKAETQVKIIQPYHYPMIKFDQAMHQAAKKGVKSMILTSGQRDQPVFKSIFNYMLFRRLIQKGIKVYETKQRLLHTKVYLADHKFINLGSMNNDRWSWKINNEVNIAITDQRSYQFIDNYFQKMRHQCRPVTNDYQISAGRAASISFWQTFLYLSEIVMSKQGKPEEDYIEYEHEKEHGHEEIQKLAS